MKRANKSKRKAAQTYASKGTPKTSARTKRGKKPKALSSRKHRVHLAYAAGLSAAPHFGPAASLTEQGRTANFVISYDPDLGDAGPVIANYLVQSCEYDYSRASAMFQVEPANLPFEISVIYSSAGAWHEDPCVNTAIGVGAITTNPPDALFLRSLMLSEVVEVLGATLDNGWQCSFSNGEALSRVIPDDLVPCTKPKDFISGYIWLDSQRNNWVDETDHTDRNYDSIGCGVMFLNWLHYQLGYTWNQIVAAGAPTLAGTYQNLTGQSDGFTQFRTQLDSKFPVGVPSGLVTDNVFPL
jgi:hypothetical protein